MIITLHRKGHLEGTHPLQLNEPKSGQTEPSRPSLGNQLNRVFLIVSLCHSPDPLSWVSVLVGGSELRKQSRSNDQCKK